jgi:hypothetical protein
MIIYSPPSVEIICDVPVNITSSQSYPSQSIPGLNKDIASSLSIASFEDISN